MFPYWHCFAMCKITISSNRRVFAILWRATCIFAWPSVYGILSLCLKLVNLMCIMYMVEPLPWKTNPIGHKNCGLKTWSLMTHSITGGYIEMSRCVFHFGLKTWSDDPFYYIEISRCIFHCGLKTHCLWWPIQLYWNVNMCLSRQVVFHGRVLTQIAVWLNFCCLPGWNISSSLL